MSWTGSGTKSSWRLDRRWRRRGGQQLPSDERKPLAGISIPSKERDGLLAIEIYDIAGERHANQLSEAAVSGSVAANAGIDLKDGSPAGSRVNHKGSGRPRPDYVSEREGQCWGGQDAD